MPLVDTVYGAWVHLRRNVAHGVAVLCSARETEKIDQVIEGVEYEELNLFRSLVASWLSQLTSPMRALVDRQGRHPYREARDWLTGDGVGSSRQAVE